MNMELFLGFIAFLRIFLFVLSVLYLLKIAYDIAKVSTLKEGRVELGKYGLLYVGFSISYIISIMLT